MYKGCIFDLDGTLANTLTSIAYFGNKALNDLNLNSIKTEEYKLMVGNGADKLMMRMLERSCGDTSKWHELRKIYDNYYENNPLYLVTPYDGILSLLKKLTAHGVKLAVLSNKPHNMTNQIVEALFEKNTFLAVQGQLEGIPHKPDPTAVLKIIKQMELNANEIIYIGDSGVDIETGKNSKLDTTGVLWGFRTRKELKAATFFANNATELENIILGKYTLNKHTQ